MNLADIKKWGLARKLGDLQKIFNAGTASEQAAFRSSVSGDAVQSQTIDNLVKLTQAEYDALAVKDPATLYVIVG